MVMLMFEETVKFIHDSGIKRFSRDMESLRKDLNHIINLFTNECDLNLIYGHYNRNALVIRAILRAKLHIVTKNQESIKNADINNFFTFFAVGFNDSFFHVFNCIIHRNDVSKFEESSHHNHIDS